VLIAGGGNPCCPGKTLRHWLRTTRQRLFRGSSGRGPGRHSREVRGKNQCVAGRSWTDGLGRCRLC